MSDAKEGKFNCGKCGIEIGGHNKHLHDGMCDGCFFDKCFHHSFPFSKNSLIACW